MCITLKLGRRSRGLETTKNWKSGDTCIWEGIYGTVTLIVGDRALIEFDGYRQTTVPLSELDRPPRMPEYPLANRGSHR